jgi:Na+/melibiose symporter-like transporter
MPRPVTVVVAMCAASAGAHAALIPQHLDHEPGLGIAFVAATAVLLATTAALTYRPDGATVAQTTTLVLAALIGAYAVNVTTGLPWLSHGPEAVDLIGLATKSAEVTGLLFSIYLAPITGGRGSLTHKEARP